MGSGRLHFIHEDCLVPHVMISGCKVRGLLPLLHSRYLCSVSLAVAELPQVCKCVGHMGFCSAHSHSARLVL